MDVSDDISREQIEQVCATFSDSPGIVMEIARLKKMKPLGVAWKHLSYFLDGPGPRDSMSVDLPKLWREDAGVRRRVTSAILTDMKWNRLQRGQVDIQQGHFSVEDWRLALGAINVSWALLPNVGIPGFGIFRFRTGPLVRLWFTDVYDWHPEDSTRRTQCVHEAAQKLIEMGKASTFVMTGSAEVILNSEDVR